MIRHGKDRVISLSIRIVVKCLEWQVVIAPDGKYVIYGPIWPGLEPAILTSGKLGYGFAMPGIEKAIAIIIEAKLKS